MVRTYHLLQPYQGLLVFLQDSQDAFVVVPVALTDSNLYGDL